MEAGIDGIAFIVETATHTYSKDSYTTALGGKRKAWRSASLHPLIS